MKKIKKLIIMPLLMLMLIMSLASCTKTNNSLFLYISGSDLESDTGEASKMLNAIKNSKYSKDLNIYGIIGGSSSYSLPILKTNKTSLFQIEGNKIEILEENDSNMGDSKTLASFIDYTSSKRGGLNTILFWGHGYEYGICRDDNYNDHLSFKELKEGLGSSQFDLAILNCCYGANFDLINFMSDNVNYAVASTDLFPSSGFDYNAMLKELSNGADAVKIGAGIINSTKQKYQGNDILNRLTLSLIDLTKIKNNKNRFNEFFSYLVYDFKSFFKAMNRAYSVNNSLKDLGDIFNHYDTSDNAKELFKSLVIYQINGNKTDISGLSIYYRNQFNNKDYLAYQKNAYYNSYLKLLSSRVNYENNKFIAFQGLASKPNSIYTIGIENSDYLAGLSYALYDDNNNLLREDFVGLSTIDGSNDSLEILISDKALFSLSLGGISLSLELYTFENTIDTTSFIYRAPMYLNNQPGELLFKYTYKDSIADGIYNGDYSIVGFLYNDQIESLNSGDLIKIGEEEFIYNNEEIVKNEIATAKLIIIAEDIYGKQYFSNLVNVKRVLNVN